MAVTVSPEFQVVIPKEIRESMDIKPGTKLEVFRRGNCIQYVLVRDIRELCGFLKGANIKIERDEEDRM